MLQVIPPPVAVVVVVVVVVMRRRVIDARAGDLEPGLGLAALELTLGSGPPTSLNSYPPVDSWVPCAHFLTCETFKPSFAA